MQRSSKFKVQSSKFKVRPPTATPSPILSVARLLSEAETILATAGISTARLDAEVLLAHVLGFNRAGLYVRLQDCPLPAQVEVYDSLVQRRAQREPLQYITGSCEFWSLEFAVDPRVLIPRPETEVVVETVLQLLSPAAFRILDVGTGSGCIAIALATELPHAEVWAVDSSAAALTVANENARRLGVAERLRFRQGDLFAAVAQDMVEFDLIVSNPPYIASSDLATLQPEVRDWEPHQALRGGQDGLDFYRQLLHDSLAYLRPGWWLVMELGAGQNRAVVPLIQAQSNFKNGFCVRDYAGHERVAVACKQDISVS